MSTCSNCYSNCAEIQSDKCVKYTGIDITVLGIRNGDSMNYVTAAIAGFLTSTLDASGIKYELEPGNICKIVSDKLVDCTDISQKDISNALSAAICDIDAKVIALEDFNVSLEASYTPNCISGITGTEGTQVVVQAVINKLCTVSTDLDALELDVATNYVLISDIDTYVANYIVNNPIGGAVTGYASKMVPYTVVEYYGPTNVFDASGSGIGDFAQIYLCNGNNGTPDKRGRVAVGATSGMGGGAFPTSTDPIVSGNPTYNLYSVAGVNTVALSVAQLPAHTHTTTVSSAGDHSHTYTQYTLDQEVASTGSGVRSLNKNNTQGATFSTNTTGAHIHTVTVNSVGSGSGHTNVQPVLACYYIMYIPTV